MPDSSSNDYETVRRVGAACHYDYLLYQAQERLEESKRLVEVLRLTIERRCPTDDALDNALAAVETELILLSTSIGKLQQGEQ